ncbi:MAG: hypothetical protein IJ460_06805 [Clostridia bacterium]|nr:hypothetical protein [Clostridia bacterium]
MFNLFGNNCRNGEGNSSILWFIILVILLFMNNDNGNCCDCDNHCC